MRLQIIPLESDSGRGFVFLLDFNSEGFNFQIHILL
jgi:hypothetical protein